MIFIYLLLDYETFILPTLILMSTDYDSLTSF